MANLMIAEVCNLECAYCFAGEHMRAVKASGAPAFISTEAFEERLDLLDRLGIGEARLIGGEPTLHPQFAALVQRARQRGKRVAVFSHGVLSGRALDCLAAIRPEDCTVLVNANAQGRAQAEKRIFARRAEVLRALGERVLLGYNIYQVDFAADFLLPLILETGSRKAIRLGLAQPALGGQNACLHPKQYPRLGPKIAGFARRASQAGITLEFDCGFVRCMFSESELETLDQAGVKVGWHCGPVPDIDLGGMARHCFPLASRVGAATQAANSFAALVDALADQVRSYRIAGIYRECSACKYKLSGACSGGCLANTLARFRQSPGLRLVY